MTRKGAGATAGPLSPFCGSMLALPPRHMPCESCGASVGVDAWLEHVCEDARRLDYLLFQSRHEIRRFELELGTWLESPAGRFEQYYAARRRH